MTNLKIIVARHKAEEHRRRSGWQPSGYEAHADRETLLHLLAGLQPLYWTGKEWVRGPGPGFVVPVAGIGLCLLCGTWDGAHTDDCLEPVIQALR